MRLVSAMVVVLALGCADTDSGTTTQSDDTGAGASSEGSSGGASTGRDDTGSGATMGSTEGDATSAGPPLPGACVEDSECRLYDDCCTCDAFASDEEPPACEADCERTLCEQWGITETICSHTCHLRLVDCDPALIMCADPMPQCDAGFAPSIEQRCWTRHCVPIELCMPY